MVTHICDLSTWQQGHKFEASLDYLGKQGCLFVKKLDIVGIPSTREVEAGR